MCGEKGRCLRRAVFPDYFLHPEETHGKGLNDDPATVGPTRSVALNPRRHAMANALGRRQSTKKMLLLIVINVDTYQKP